MRHAIAICLLLASPLSAQSKGTELDFGVAAFTFTHYSSSGLFTSDNTSDFRVGGQHVAAGFYLSPSAAVETTLDFDWVHHSGESASAVQIGVAVPIYSNAAWGHRGTFVAPRVSMLDNLSGGTSGAEFSAGLGLGHKVQLSDFVSLRFEAIVMHLLKHDAYTTLSGVFGVSIFLK